MTNFYIKSTIDISIPHWMCIPLMYYEHELCDLVIAVWPSGSRLCVIAVLESSIKWKKYFSGLQITVGFSEGQNVSWSCIMIQSIHFSLEGSQ